MRRFRPHAACPRGANVFPYRPKTRPHGKREVVARHAVNADKRRGAGLFDPKDNIESPKHRLVLGAGVAASMTVGRRRSQASAAIGC